jgi:hypothetical protein
MRCFHDHDFFLLNTDLIMLLLLLVPPFVAAAEVMGSAISKCATLLGNASVTAAGGETEIYERSQPALAKLCVMHIFLHEDAT